MEFSRSQKFGKKLTDNHFISISLSWRALIHLTYCASFISQMTINDLSHLSQSKWHVINSETRQRADWKLLSSKRASSGKFLFNYLIENVPLCPHPWIPVESGHPDPCFALSPPFQKLIFIPTGAISLSLASYSRTTQESVKQGQKLNLKKFNPNPRAVRQLINLFYRKPLPNRPCVEQSGRRRAGRTTFLLSCHVPTDLLRKEIFWSLLTGGINEWRTDEKKTRHKSHQRTYGHTTTDSDSPFLDG